MQYYAPSALRMAVQMFKYNKENRNVGNGNVIGNASDFVFAVVFERRTRKKIMAIYYAYMHVINLNGSIFFPLIPHKPIARSHCVGRLRVYTHPIVMHLTCSKNRFRAPWFHDMCNERCALTPANLYNIQHLFTPVNTATRLIVGGERANCSSVPHLDIWSNEHRFAARK